MFDGTLDGLGEATAINEGLQSDDAAVPGLPEIEMFEKQYISEVDRMRIHETTNIMAAVFSEDVIASWSEMSLNEKTDIINEYYVKAGENLGIDTKGVIVEPMHGNPGTISFGYNSGDGYIHLNEAVVNDPSMLGQVLNTATHEMRHQFQYAALSNPSNFSDIPDSVRKTWEYEWSPVHYISPDYDYEGYYNQAIECDARGFSEYVLKVYMGKMHLN